jgi:hypothetical protein
MTMTATAITRRRALQVLGAAMLSGVAGQLLSATRTRAALDAAGPGLDDFTAVSRTLTGKPQLDPALALGIYHALRQAAPDADAKLAALKAALAQDGALDAGGKTVFADAQKAQQALSQSILQAWYLGVVGKGKQAACLAYIDALANRAVAAQLVPPSYSYGPCGAWQACPESL